MTTKTSHRKAKAPTSSIISKIAPATTTSRRLSTTAASPTKASKSPSKNLKAAPPSATVAPQVPANPVRDSKQARLIAKLRAKPGATINQMMALTGWQAHTVRGTISGVLRKKLGLTVDCQLSSDSGEHLYRIVNSPVRK
jgi:Protein of unknown function (DUF3489)